MTRSQQAARWLADHVADGETMQSAGARFGISRQAVQQGWRLLFGARPAPAARAPHNDQVVTLAQSGMDDETISQKLSLTRAQVRAICRRENIEVKHIPPWAERSARLAAAARAVEAGVPPRDAAIDHEISRSALDKRIRALGIRATVSASRRKDGRVARAVARVLGGEKVADACRAERCATSVVYVQLKRHREGT